MSVNLMPSGHEAVHPHILVVQDEFFIRLMLIEVLQEAGYFVIVACNADEALTILSTRLPDLIITDVRMPGSCDGIEFMAKVRKANLDLPIIVTSGHFMPEAGQFTGHTHFLSKPYDYTAVIDLVDHELRH